MKNAYKIVFTDTEKVYGVTEYIPKGSITSIQKCTNIAIRIVPDK